MAEALGPLIDEMESHVAEARAEAALRGLKAMASGEPGERPRKLGRDAIELLAQLVDLKEDRRSRRRDEHSAERERRQIDAAALQLIGDARTHGERTPFGASSLAAGRAAMENYARRGEEEARKIKGAVFISYRRTDTADAAGRLYDRLRHEFGHDAIFMDVETIPLGIDFRVHITDKLSQCRACLVMIGDEWTTCCGEDGRRRLDNESDPVRTEVETALRVGKPVIPLLIGAARMPKPEELPSTIAQLHFNNGVQIRPNPDFDSDVERLVTRLRAYVD